MVQYMKVSNEYTYIKAAMNSLEEKFIACVSDCFVNRIQNYSRNVISTGILGPGYADSEYDRQQHLCWEKVQSEIRI